MHNQLLYSSAYHVIGNDIQKGLECDVFRFQGPCHHVDYGRCCDIWQNELLRGKPRISSFA